MVMRAGIDVGSTTVKLVFLNKQNQSILQNMNAIFRCQSSNGTHFKRRASKDRCRPTCDNEHNWLWWYGGLAEVLGIPFVQEVIACTRTVETIIPETDVAIELGGEDAKITF